MQNRDQQSIRHLPAKLMIHFASDEETASQHGGRSLEDPSQVPRHVLLCELFCRGQSAGGFQSYDYVHRTPRKTERRSQEIRAAKRIEHSRIRQRCAAEFLFLKIAKPVNQPGFGFHPSSVQQVAMFFPIRAGLKTRERTAGFARKAGEKTPGIVNLARPRYC